MDFQTLSTWLVKFLPLFLIIGAVGFAIAAGVYTQKGLKQIGLECLIRSFCLIALSFIIFNF